MFLVNFYKKPAKINYFCKKIIIHLKLNLFYNVFMDKKKKSKIYYLYGIIFIILAIIFITVGTTMALINPEKTYYGWIGFALTFIGLIFLFICTYYFKKGSFLKLNENIKKSREDFINDLKKLESKRDEAEHLNDKKDL